MSSPYEFLFLISKLSECELLFDSMTIIIFIAVAKLQTMKFPFFTAFSFDTVGNNQIVSVIKSKSSHSISTFKRKLLMPGSKFPKIYRSKFHVSIFLRNLDWGPCLSDWKELINFQSVTSSFLLHKLNSILWTTYNLCNHSVPLQYGKLHFIIMRSFTLFSLRNAAEFVKSFDNFIGS